MTLHIVKHCNNAFHICLIKLSSYGPYRNYYWGIKGISVNLFSIINLNNIFVLQTLFWDEYNIKFVFPPFLSFTTHILYLQSMHQ